MIRRGWSDRLRDNDGFVLVAVLWLLGALSALVSAYAIYVIEGNKSVALNDDRVRAQALASAAVELAAYHQLAAPTQERPVTRQFTFGLAQAHVSVTYRSEAGRIDLNHASKDLLANLFSSMGVRTEQSEQFAQSVIDWRTRPAATAENNSKIPKQNKYKPRGDLFPSVGELALITEIPAAVVARALPLLTTYSGRTQINILAADPAVLLAIPGMTRERVLALLKQRAISTDKQTLLALMGEAQSYATLDSGQTFRLSIDVAFDKGGRANFEVVIKIFEEGNAPFAVLSWRDRLDASAQEAGA
jgi:general secretion pathway protein K